MNNDDFDIKIYMKPHLAGLGVEMLTDHLKNGQKAALIVGDDAPSRAIEKVIEHNNPDTNDNPDTWDLYFGSDPRDIALDFIVWGITEYEDIAAFIDEHGGTGDKDRIYYYVTKILSAPPIEYSDEEPPF